jgi:molybdopterin molybdotransferase
MALLPVSEALDRLLDGAGPEGLETVALRDAAERVLAESVMARRTQPPFDAAAMDGYAVRSQDVERAPVRLQVTGTAPAGKRFGGAVGPGQAVRIFTGAPLPDGADALVIQEDTRKLENDEVEILAAAAAGRHIRRKGLDFSEGDILLRAGRLLDPAALSLAAAANQPSLAVVRQPLLAVIATGDELVPLGSEPGADQIIASSAYGVAAIARSVGAQVLDLGIAPDRKDAISAAIRQAMAAGADVIVTLGGASVGDHDLIRDVLSDEGMRLDFWKIAMRPGKPLMFGRLGRTRFLGTPGNPVAGLVCSHLFLKPLLARLGGRDYAPDILGASLGSRMPANDLRQDYVRATLSSSANGLVAMPFGVQDSSMVKTFADADALIVREPFAPEAAAGDPCAVIRLR